MKVMNFYQKSDTVCVEPAWFADDVPSVIEGDANRIRGPPGPSGAPREGLRLALLCTRGLGLATHPKWFGSGMPVRSFHGVTRCDFDSILGCTAS